MRRTKGKGIQTGVRKKTPKSERGKKQSGGEKRVNEWRSDSRDEIVREDRL